MSEDDIDYEIDKAIAKDDAKKQRYWTQNIGINLVNSVKFTIGNSSDLFDEYYLRFMDKTSN